jgi:hypothetical protein
MTLAIRSGTATCLKKSEAAALSKDSVSELFSWLERAVEHKVDGIIIDVYNVEESALTRF